MKRFCRTESGESAGRLTHRLAGSVIFPLLVAALGWALSSGTTTFGQCEESLVGSGPNGWAATVARIVPATPSTADVLQVTLSGCWGDTCAPNMSSISVVDTNVYFDAILNYPTGVLCLAVMTTWHQTQYLDPLPAGNYRLYARVLGDPHTPPAYGLLTNFAVVVPVGSLKVTIEPADAAIAGGQWQVDAGAWQNSRSRLDGLTIGSHTVHFRTIADWTSPADQVVTISLDSMATAAGAYTIIDTIPDWWRLLYFGSVTDALAGASCDPDGDGLPNWKEFRANTDPTNGGSLFGITSLVRSNDGLLITWMMGIDRTNALQAESGDSAGGYPSGSFMDIFTVTNAVGSLTNFFEMGGSNGLSRFYRVRLVP